VKKIYQLIQTILRKILKKRMRRKFFLNMA